VIILWGWESPLFLLCLIQRIPRGLVQWGQALLILLWKFVTLKWLWWVAKKLVLIIGGWILLTLIAGIIFAIPYWILLMLRVPNEIAAQWSSGVFGLVYNGFLIVFGCLAAYRWLSARVNPYLSYFRDRQRIKREGIPSSITWNEACQTALSYRSLEIRRRYLEALRAGWVMLEGEIGSVPGGLSVNLAVNEELARLREHWLERAAW
jgi:hypothetical protein